MNNKIKDNLSQASDTSSGFLKVSELHTIYWTAMGNPSGIPVIVCHGGPGGGASPGMARHYDLTSYHVIMFDQRGCGQSLPHSELRENTTFDLVADMEKLRKHFDIESWVVAGGSWGSTLSLAYAVTHPERVLALLLRGIFLLTDAELRWFYQSGAGNLFPDAFEPFETHIPEDERSDLIAAYFKRLTSDDAETRQAAARIWSKWEGSTLTLAGPKATPARFDDSHFVDAFARIECHYFINKGFLPHDGWLLEQVQEKLTDIPGYIVHGRYDVITPLKTAWALHKVWPASELTIVPAAGHSASEPGITKALRVASDKVLENLRPKRRYGR